jgi:hypothetical protein
VDPHYGTEADLQQLLLTAKTKGELLLLQLVKKVEYAPNHAGQYHMPLPIIANLRIRVASYNCMCCCQARSLSCLQV